ncbi:hypothetical protein HK413_12535 [Mucilaginibacter sp. S1162]|uniref:Transporter n=1 Tax=Mucilaginibacter humi TaxID=2732510 RepID=A0ABX1W376_9SPHI|nr:hypothetical protein [Mucilaginibacter humi]NNU34682.1 hypothetical protein [Mucilaginibacter humi]
MIKPYKALLLCTLCCNSFIALAQTKTTGEADSKSGPEIKLNYLSNSVFMGRADSVRTAVITPQLKYAFSNGIYLSGSLYVVPNRKKNKVDGGDVTLGYDFDLSDKLSGGLSFSKFFYSSNSTQVTSSQSSTISGNLSFDNDFVTPTLTVDYNFNKQAIAGDLFLNIALSRDFEIDGVFGKDDALTLSPTIEANTGTQNFYNGYIVYRKRKNVQNSAAATALLQTYQSELSQYKLLDFECAIPVEYSRGNFTLNLTPTYALAQNQFKSAAVVKALGLTTQSSVFYFDIGVALKF